MSKKRDVLAWQLNGREYGKEITAEEEAAAKASGLVVLFGGSDDLAEFRGAIHDEGDCYDGGTLVIFDGALFDCDCGCECKHAESAHSDAKKHGAEIEAVWCEEPVPSGWSYKTDIPHATFDVMEDGELYCRGIVFALADAA